MPLAAIRRFTDRLRKAAAQPVSSGAPARPPAPQAELAGCFRLADGVHLRRQLLALLAPGARVILLDCSRVASMDGCGLAVLVEFMETCRNRHVRLRLIEPSLRMRETFRLYGLGEAIDTLAERRHTQAPEVEEGLLIVIEEDFAESIRLEALPGPAVIEEEDFPDSIRLPAAA